MPENKLASAKNRYIQLVETEALLLDLFEVIEFTPEIDVKEYRKDIQSSLRFVAHLKHREIGTITGIESDLYENGELPMVVGDERKNDYVQNQQIPQQRNNSNQRNKRRRNR
jgi:hypothetical protein